MTPTLLMRVAPFAAGAMLAGCVPYPVYKTLQPAATISVIDQYRAPVPGAEVILIAGAHPSAFERGRTVRTTDAAGHATFDAVREMRVETMALHGAEEFFWNWCVRKDGFSTFVSSNRAASDFKPAMRVQLAPGVSQACPTPRIERRQQ